MSNKNKGLQTILWWVGWITLTIVSFFVASSIWSPIIAKKFGSIHETKNAVIWITAVFGTWMVILVPLIIYMYSKVDKTYEDARLRREKAAMQFRSISVELEKRRLPESVSKMLTDVKPTIQGGHLVTAHLKDGRKIPNVFISNKEEILGIYDAKEMTFEGKDVVDIKPNDLSESIPTYFTANWLRLDGVKAPK